VITPWESYGTYETGSYLSYFHFSQKTRKKYHADYVDQSPMISLDSISSNTRRLGRRTSSSRCPFLCGRPSVSLHNAAEWTSSRASPSLQWLPRTRACWVSSRRRVIFLDKRRVPSRSFGSSSQCSSSTRSRACFEDWSSL
jgi:hypothetical protein